jgi:phosphoribosylformimino-5-aminoimidazole carboxamide ribotide isomerase
MFIYPAIDIKNGEVVRLRQGKFDEQTTFNKDPMAQALKWKQEGASLIHVVDLDGAVLGRPFNDDALGQIMAAGVPVEAGGGIRTLEEIERKLEMGVRRVILGTAAVYNRTLLVRAIVQYGPDRIAVGVDARNGIVSTNGWEQDTGVDALEFCQTLSQMGVTTIIYTDIAKDGMLEGPNVDETKTLIEQTGMTVIASGGISSMTDLRRAQEIGSYAAVIGQALYTGQIKLSEAVAEFEHAH